MSHPTWSYTKPLNFASYFQIIICGFLGLGLLGIVASNDWQPHMKIFVWVAAAFILVALKQLWRKGFTIDSQSITRWSGPGVPWRKATQPAKEFTSVALETVSEGGQVSLSLKRASLHGDEPPLVVASGTFFSYDALLTKSYELAQFLHLPLTVENTHIAAKDLGVDLRDRLASQELPEASLSQDLPFTVEREEGKLIISKPSLGIRALKRHWFCSLTILLGLSFVFVYPVLGIPIVQPWFTLLCFAAAFFWLSVLNSQDRVQRIILNDASVELEAVGGFLPRESACVDLADVLHVGLSSHHKETILCFFTIHGRLDFGLAAPFEAEDWQALLTLVQHDLAQRAVTESLVPPKLNPKGMGLFLVGAYLGGLFLLMLVSFPPSKPRLQTFSGYDITDLGTVYYYDNTEDGQLVRWTPDVSTGEVISIEPLRSTDFKVSGDGKTLLLRRAATADSSELQLATYDLESKKLTLLPADTLGARESRINTDGSRIIYETNGGIGLYEAEKGQCQLLYPSPEFARLSEECLSTDGSKLALFQLQNPRKLSILITADQSLEDVQLSTEKSLDDTRYSDLALSGQAQFLAFTRSLDTPEDEQASPDRREHSSVFVHGLDSGETHMISPGRKGLIANGPSWNPSIDSSGRYVAFCSEASNLVKRDDNNAVDIFLFDRQSNELELVSLFKSGWRPRQTSQSPRVSADGRFVFFEPGTAIRPIPYRYNIYQKVLDRLVLPEE